MATNAALRLQMAEKLMRTGEALAIANPRGATVDAILVKEWSCHIPANATDVHPEWYEYTGNACNTAYTLGI